MKRILTLVAVTAFALVASGCTQRTEQLEPGWGAVRIDYRTGVRTSISAGGRITYDTMYERVAKYPLRQLDMVLRRVTDPTGKVTRDDSVECNDKNFVDFHVDSTTRWKVNPAQIADLYERYPDEPLEHDDLNKSIENRFVRHLVLNTISLACSGTTWDHAGTEEGRKYIQEYTEPIIRKEMAENFLILEDFRIGEINLKENERTLIQQRVQAQQGAITAKIAEERAQADARASRAKAEADAVVAVAAAKGQADATIEKARGDGQAELERAKLRAQAIREEQAALAAAPEYRAFMVALEQAKHPPMVQGSATPLIQVPAPSR